MVRWQSSSIDLQKSSDHRINIQKPFATRGALTLINEVKKHGFLFYLLGSMPIIIPYTIAWSQPSTPISVFSSSSTYPPKGRAPVPRDAATNNKIGRAHV